MLRLWSVRHKFNHIQEDFMALNQCNQDVFYKRNKEHYSEWINISDPNVRKQNNQEPIKKTSEEKENIIKHMAEIQYEIHFHTFNKSNFEKL